jgi:imidazolonepropionase-like amidohydrolase
MRLALILVLLAVPATSGLAQAPGGGSETLVLVPDAVFDGVTAQLHRGWRVGVRGDRIVAVGPPAGMPSGAREVALPGLTLLPGLIDAHSHLLLHPYDEASWDDQVLREPVALRVARATVQAQRTLWAGFTTLRDLGTEGAGYADVGLKEAIEEGIIPGPRLLVTTRAIVATGAYGPRGFAPEGSAPLMGAEVADGVEGLTRVVRDQIGKGADWIKVYADYGWGPEGEARPTFTLDELTAIVEVARSSGRPVVAHASSAEGMRRAVLAGVETIDHGDEGTPEIFRLMRERGVALCPTVAAGEAVSQYRGWRKGLDPEPGRIVAKRQSLLAALEAGVTLCNGSDAGVFSHGENVRELELLVDYGVPVVEVLRAATSVTARVLHLDDQVGQVRAGLLADLIAVEGNPLESISALRAVRFVMQSGRIIRQR